MVMKGRQLVRIVFFLLGSLASMHVSAIQIDILVLYTKSAKQLYPDVEARIDFLFSRLNQIHFTSSTGLTFNPVLIMPYLNGASTAEVSSEGLSEISADAALTQIRDDNGADLVVLFTESSVDLCGVAYLGTGNASDGISPFSFNRDLTAFSISAIDCDGATLAHEIGHNMGLDHSVRQSGEGGVVPYGRGHGVDGVFVTVMGYSSSFGAAPQSNRFSKANDLGCSLFSCGIQVGLPNDADSFLAMAIVDEDIRDYKPTRSVPASRDTDGDSLPDTWEWQNGLNAYQQDANDDLDQDDLTNAEEFNLGTVAFESDTDGDRIPDGLEVSSGFNPLNEADGNLDADSDAFPNWLELLSNSNPNNAGSQPSIGHYFSFETGTLPAGWVIPGSATRGWSPSSILPSDGNYSLRSNDISDNQSAIIEWKPDLDKGMLYFDFSVFSEPFFDFFEFWVDGEKVFSASGSRGWQSRSYNLETGAHTLSWRYVKDGSFSNGRDSAWIDNVAFVPDIQTKLSASNDFDGDNDSDVLLRNSNNGFWRRFTMENGFVESSSGPGLWTSLSWEHRAIGDFDGDADSDVLLRNPNNGFWRRFTMQDGVAVSGGSPGLWTSTSWEYQVVGDFDGDGDDDVLLRNPNNGFWRRFTMENGFAESSGSPGLWTSTSWEYQAVGDFDGDGDDDVLLRNPNTGFWRLFIMQNGVAVSSNGTGLWTAQSWEFRAVGDFDGDGDEDLLLRNPNNGFWRRFTLEDGVVVSSASPGLWTSTVWEFRVVGDFDGDGDDDVLLRDPNNGFWRRFTMQNGAAVSSGSPGLWTSTSYQVQ